VLFRLIEWRIERPRIEGDLRRTVRVGPPNRLQDIGLSVAHDDARKLLARMDRLEERLQHSGWFGKIFKRTVEFLTLLAFGVIIFSWQGIAVDHRIAEIAHWEAPAGVAFMAFEGISHRIRHRLLRTLQGWYNEVDAYTRACDAEIRSRWRARRPPDPS
jgi:hypothetical protein